MKYSEPTSMRFSTASYWKTADRAVISNPPAVTPSHLWYVFSKKFKKEPRSALKKDTSDAVLIAESMTYSDPRHDYVHSQVNVCDAPPS